MLSIEEGRSRIVSCLLMLHAPSSMLHLSPRLPVPVSFLWSTTWVKNRAPVRIKPASHVPPAAGTYQDSTRMAGFRSSAFVVNDDGSLDLLKQRLLKRGHSRLVALDLGVDLTFGKFSDVRVGGITAQNVLDLNATSGRFTVGISPSRR